jgi:hypothetical protein
MLTAFILLASVSYLFRRPLGRWLARYVPDRVTRQRLLGTIIAGFLIVFLIRLGVRFWG